MSWKIIFHAKYNLVNIQKHQLGINKKNLDSNLRPKNMNYTHVCEHHDKGFDLLDICLRLKKLNIFPIK